MENIEIKAKYFDLENGKKIAENLKSQYVGCDHQVDTYFKTSSGRFKLRESSLSGAYLVPYIRDNRQDAKSSHYVLIPVASATETKKIFSTLLGIDSVVEKKRHIYLKDNIRIHLDDVVNLGTFFELEAVCNEDSIIEKEVQKVNELLDVFQVKTEDLLSGSYKEM
ncbi:MAG: class IV adenylate cyclase [Oligoflexia bacterium]|nr:class IV adenylate cyclase [Oligoflexia bacterium]MBF0364710.1 class IV adenylate cyclase [Oligoflexia bacterium]